MCARQLAIRFNPKARVPLPRPRRPRSRSPPVLVPIARNDPSTPTTLPPTPIFVYGPRFPPPFSFRACPLSPSAGGRRNGWMIEMMTAAAATGDAVISGARSYSLVFPPPRRLSQYDREISLPRRGDGGDARNGAAVGAIGRAARRRRCGVAPCNARKAMRVVLTCRSELSRSADLRPVQVGRKCALIIVHSLSMVEAGPISHERFTAAKKTALACAAGSPPLCRTCQPRARRPPSFCIQSRSFPLSLVICKKIPFRLH